MKLESEKITRREFVSSAIAVAGASAIPLNAMPPGLERPNILFILADDMGYGDLSCYGRPDYSTPNLDRFAEQGVRFTDAYAAAPVCTPTRCGFITGRYPARLPVGNNDPLPAKKFAGARPGLPPDHPTVASLLKGAGYETALVGKWHLGYLPEYGPLQSGFDHFYGIMSSGVNYFTHRDGAGDLDFYEDKVPVDRIGYITDLLTERAVQFIASHRKKPFYLSLHYTAPHGPWQGPQDEQTSSSSGSRKIYAAMMKSLDDGIGKVLRALIAAGLDKKTLVIFTSDNGGEGFSYHWPFTGKKGDLLEGGIRVPAIVRWSGVIPHKQKTDQVAITMDWTATILAAAQTSPAPGYQLDGQDLLPVMRGQVPTHDRTLFWRTNKQGAARSGNWKYLKEGDQDLIFDFSADVMGIGDFEGKHPDVLARLRSEYQQWEAQMLPLPTKKK